MTEARALSGRHNRACSEAQQNDHTVEEASRFDEIGDLGQTIDAHPVRRHRTVVETAGDVGYVAKPLLLRKQRFRHQALYDRTR